MPTTNEQKPSERIGRISDEIKEKIRRSMNLADRHYNSMIQAIIQFLDEQQEAKGNNWTEKSKPTSPRPIVSPPGYYQQKEYNKDPFLGMEKEIMEKITYINNLYITLDQAHPSALMEWNQAIHKLQDIMGFRVLQRNYPNYFYQANNGK